MKNITAVLAMSVFAIAAMGTRASAWPWSQTPSKDVVYYQTEQGKVEVKAEQIAKTAQETSTESFQGYTISLKDGILATAQAIPADDERAKYIVHDVKALEKVTLPVQQAVDPSNASDLSALAAANAAVAKANAARAAKMSALQALENALMRQPGVKDEYDNESDQGDGLLGD